MWWRIEKLCDANGEARIYIYLIISAIFHGFVSEIFDTKRQHQAAIKDANVFTYAYKVLIAAANM